MSVVEVYVVINAIDRRLSDADLNRRGLNWLRG